jgi:dipeptidyl aminopeptidase/acylaminoacyl peptidase
MATLSSICSGEVKAFPPTKGLLCRMFCSGKRIQRERKLVSICSFVLLTTDHLDDVTAGLSFLKNLPGVDSHRIAVVGHSFGGQLTILAAERDSTLRAAVTFSAAASSWESSSELRERMLTAVRKTTVPIMLLHAENDYSSAPGKAMADELARLGKPHVLKIYPPVGRTADDGHNFVYTTVAEWEGDVFGFLDQYVRH